MSLTFKVSLFCLQLFTKAFHLSKLIWNSSDQLSPTLKRWRTILRHDVLLFVSIVFFFLDGLNYAFSTHIKLRSVCYGSELFVWRIQVVRRHFMCSVASPFLSALEKCFLRIITLILKLYLL